MCQFANWCVVRSGCSPTDLLRLLATAPLLVRARLRTFSAARRVPLTPTDPALLPLRGYTALLVQLAVFHQAGKVAAIPRVSGEPS